MEQTLSHTASLQASADKIWIACKHFDDILSGLLPEYFVKIEYLHGHGEPGSIRLITTETSIEHFRTERLEEFDDATKTLGFSLLRCDSQYSMLSVAIRFVASEAALTEASWTATFVPVGDEGSPEHVKLEAAHLLKTLERIVQLVKTFTHTETLDVSLDLFWNAFEHLHEIAVEQMPHLFESTTLIEGNGGPGTVRVIKFRPGCAWSFAAAYFSGTVTERVDFIDPVDKRMEYTILKGNPDYKYFSVTTHFRPGPSAGTTSAEWVATYISCGDRGPPEHIRDLVMSMWKRLAATAKANPERFP